MIGESRIVKEARGNANRARGGVWHNQFHFDAFRFSRSQFEAHQLLVQEFAVRPSHVYAPSLRAVAYEQVKHRLAGHFYSLSARVSISYCGAYGQGIPRAYTLGTRPKLNSKRSATNCNTCCARYASSHYQRQHCDEYRRSKLFHPATKCTIGHGL